MQYTRVTRFDFIVTNGIEKIITKTNSDEILYYLLVDEVYNVIETAHVTIGHGGRDRLCK